MPISPEIRQLAMTVVDEHGAGAELHASMRAAEMLAAGNLDAEALWRRVLDAIGALRAE